MAVIAALMPGRGYPLGLGEIELNSALNQELEAEIEVLSAEPEIAEQLIIKLASSEAFARAGIDRPFLLQQLKFKVITKGNTPYVMVYTQKPIREPFLSFLVEVDWPEGHLLREYTVLLDPPVYSGTAQATAPSVPPAAMESGRPFAGTDEQMMEQMDAERAPATGRPATSVYATPRAKQSGQSVAAAPAGDSGQRMSYRPMQQYSATSDEYRVQQNDTLWSLSNRLRPDQSVSVEQMMLALVRENPEAFIEENIHGIKRGYILRVPRRAEITSVDRQSAIAQVRQHTALWREYRQSQSATSPASAMEAPEGAELDQPAMGRDVEGKLSIVSVEGDQGGKSAAGQAPGGNEAKRLRAELAMAKEALESERLEKESLKSRLDELESRVKRVLEMDDAELAKLQQDLQGVKEEAAAIKPAPTPIMEEEPVMLDEAPVEESMIMEEPAPIEEPTPLAPDEEPVFADQAPVEMAEGQEPLKEVAPAPKPLQPTAVPSFAQQQPKSFIESLLDDPKMLGAFGGVLILILALFGMLLRRRRINQSEDEWVAPEDVEPLKFATDEDTSVADIASAKDITSEFEDTQINAPGEQKESLEDTVYSLKDEEEAPKDEAKDDVIAEADVYLAYGIYQQAEELLRSAIDKNPERDDYRMKLLETHFAGKNSDAFASLAEEVKARKGSDKAYWNRVLAMGQELCPEHALFSDTGVLPDIDTDDLLPKKPQTTDLELDGSGDSSGDFDLGLGDELDLGETPSFEEDADATQMLNEPLDLDNLGEAAGSADTDLGDFGGELELDDAFAETSTSETTGEVKDDLDSGFDLGELEDITPESEDKAESEVALDIDDDFSLDFEASDLGFASADEEKSENAETESDMLAETDDMSLDFDAELDLGMDSSEEESAAAEIADLDMDMDIGKELTEESVELDMGMPEDLSLDTGVTSLSTSDDDDNFDISELSEDVDEVSTKLDLARAYLDMGDREGAMSILEEVKQEGNDSQQQEAEALLKQAS
ncbi:MAG TPA: FimV/HubP family polar landmark protein [Gammaproteobacteria bacterium]